MANSIRWVTKRGDMNELEKLTLEYMAKRLQIMGDEKFLELQKEIAEGNDKTEIWRQTESQGHS